MTRAARQTEFAGGRSPPHHPTGGVRGAFASVPSGGRELNIAVRPTPLSPALIFAPYHER